MNATSGTSETDPEQRIIALVHTLRKTEQELQTLTGGQVDAVLADGGHPIFLQNAQEKLLQSENRYRSLAKATAQIVWTADAEGLVTGELPEWQAFTGQSTEEIAGYGCQRAIHPDDQKRTLETWTEAVTTRKSYDLEYRLRRHDGVYLDFAVRGVPVLAEDGSILEWVGCCMDITARKQAEEKIKIQLHELERWREATLDREDRVQSLKKDINAMLHELGRTPLYEESQPTMEKLPPVMPFAEKSEEARLAKLRSYGILDSPAEQDFDDLVTLAAHICGTPLAHISLVDENRQWFKASYGTDITETSRDVSFCNHALRQPGLFIIPDAIQDERFSHNPLVTGNPGIRFYAGSPLIAPDGSALGTLCVVDLKPGQLSEVQAQGLAVLSHHVMALVELRHQSREMARSNAALLGILEDERLAETAMRDSEALNRGVLDSMPAHIAVVDSEGTIIAVNSAWRQYGVENTSGHQDLLARTSIGTNYLAICRASRGKFSAEAMAAHDGVLAVLKGEQTHFTLEYPCHGLGRERWYILSASPLKKRNGGAVVSHLDISERKRAESQIREQAAFLDKAQDAIAVRDLNGKLLFWNKGAERMYGWLREDVLGRNMDADFYADSIKLAEVNARVIDHGEWTGELQHFTQDRTEIVVESRMTLIRDSQGNPKSVLAINTDITERKKIEAQFMRAQRMESIGTLAGGIAHDLNNILAPILMSIELLKRQSDDPQTAKILQTIQVSAKRGADIVRQVLSFARGIEGQRIEVQPKHLLNDLENIIKDTFPKDIRLQFSVPNDIWTILGDPTQVHQVLLNLSVNARDAMPNGGNLGVSVENCILDAQYAVMHSNAKPGRYVKISVTDSGMGIPPKLIDKIFEPFFTTKELSKGTGLGLSTVMAIVKSHGGVINVYSDQGKGTTFTVYLLAMELSAEALKEHSVLASLPKGNGETILVVDDESSILTITSQTLEAYGYHVMTAIDGADALAVYLQHRAEIAVVLTDMMMPVMDGAALLHALKRVNPSVKIIAASGLNAEGEIHKATSGGLQHFLIKPYTAGVMLQTIRAILDGRSPATKTAFLPPIKMT